MPDTETPQAETLGTLQELVDEGKVLEIGCSNFSAEQIDEAARAAAQVEAGNYASVQNHYSVLTRDVEDKGDSRRLRTHWDDGGPLLPPGVWAAHRQVLGDDASRGVATFPFGRARCATCS